MALELSETQPLASTTIARYTPFWLITSKGPFAPEMSNPFLLQRTPVETDENNVSEVDERLMVGAEGLALTVTVLVANALAHPPVPFTV